MEKNNIKYLLNGTAVAVIGNSPQGSIVCSIYEDDKTGEEIINYNKPYTVSNVYDNPPVEKKHEEIVKLEEKVDELGKKKYELEKQIKEIETTHAERLIKYSQYSQLQMLDKYLENKITHYVVEPGYGVSGIIEWGKETESEYANYNDKGVDRMKLLTLFGDSKGNLEWKLNKYRDDSGNYITVYPCCSYEEAIEKLTDIISKKIQVQLESGKINKEYILKAAKQYNIPVPQEYIDAVNKQTKHILQNTVNATMEKLKQDQKALEDYTSKLEGNPQ